MKRGAERRRSLTALKALGRRSRLTAGRATSWARVLPDFLIIGAQRSGTTSFYAELVQQDGVMRAAGKELHFFDMNWKRGLSWYRAHFPLHLQQALLEWRLGLRARTGEATPYYLFHPHASQRAASVVPDAAIVVLLRDPVHRAYSHYEWMCGHGYESLSAMEAFHRESERIRADAGLMAADPNYNSFAHRHFSYLARGRYLEQIENWLKYFPRERMLILRSEDFFARPAEAIRQALSFLGLPSEVVTAGVKQSTQVYGAALDEEKLRFLTDYYREPNEALYRFLGRDMGWLR